MARIVMVFEDVVGGRNDGAVDFEWMADDPIPVVEGQPVPRTLAEKQVLSVVAYLNHAFEQHGPLTPIFAEQEPDE